MAIKDRNVQLRHAIIELRDIQFKKIVLLKIRKRRIGIKNRKLLLGSVHPGHVNKTEIKS